MRTPAEENKNSHRLDLGDDWHDNEVNNPQPAQDGILRRRQVSAPAGENNDDNLVAEEGEYIEGTNTDNNENRDLQSLVYLEYVHDNGRTQYKEKDGVTIQIWDGALLLPKKSLSFIVATDPCGDIRITFYIALIVWLLQVILLVLLFWDNIMATRERYDTSNFFGIPVETSTPVIVSQYISTFLMAVTNDEIPGAYSQMFRGYDARRKMFDHAFPHTKNKKLKWHLHNFMNLLIGGLAYISALFMILQEDTVRGVLLSFATNTAITSLDSVAFTLCINEYLGRSARTGALKIALAKYNYDECALPSDIKFCCFSSRRVAYLDGKIRFLTMLGLVLVSCSETFEFSLMQTQGKLRCSQKIINDNLYNSAMNFCSKRKTLQNNTWEMISEGDSGSTSDIPFAMAAKGDKTPNVFWTIRDPFTLQKIESAYNNIFHGQMGNSVNGFDGVYLYYTCLPHDFNGIWSIERDGQDNSDFFLGLSEIYKIKSELSIDGHGSGDEICVDDTQVYSTKRGRRRIHEQSHLIGNLFNKCAYDINFGDGECNEEYNTVECAYDRLRCLSKEQNNTLSKQSPGDTGIGGYVSLIHPITAQDFVQGFVSSVTEVVNNELS